MEVNEVPEISAHQLVACIDESPPLHRWDLIFGIWQQSLPPAADTSISDETGRIFLQQGFEAWVAYALLKYPTLLSTYRKRTSISPLDRLQQSSTDSRERLATQVIDELESRPDFPDIVTKCLIALTKRSPVDPLKMAHLGKRRRTGDVNDRHHSSIAFGPGHRVDSPATSQPLSNHPPPPPHDTNTYYPTPNLSSRSPDPHTNHDTSWDGHIADSSLAGCPPPASDRFLFQTVQNPSLEAVRLLFPEHIANAIEIGPHPTEPDSYASSLMMSFPIEKFKGICQLTFDILESKLPYLACRWFNTSVECDWRGLRCLCIENGRVKITPEPTFTLEGMRKEMAQAEFGVEVFQAIEATAVFQTETRMGLSTTSTVLLKIPSSPTTKAQVQITLDEVRGTQIKQKLWKQ